MWGRIVLFIGIIGLIEGSVWSEIIPPYPLQGEVFRVHVTFPTEVEVPHLIFNGKRYPLYKQSPQEYSAVLAVPLSMEKGLYPLELIGGEYRTKTELTVREKKFPKEIITLPKSTSPLWNERQKIAEDKVAIRKALWTTSDLPFFKETFILPSTGPFTSPFGEIRLYDGVTKGQHHGFDIAVEEGTPVLAANRGKVRLSRACVLEGNCVILDHGQGLSSMYMHLRSRTVKEGDVVEKGSLLGTVGSTGLSTGPHLHWEILLFSVSTNPLRWLESIP